MPDDSTPSPRPPRAFEWPLELFLPEDHAATTLGDLEEQYAELHEERGTLRANLWYLLQIPLNLGAALMHSLYWAMVHFRDNLRLAWRHIKRNRIRTLTHSLGLVVGLACSILITLYAVNELSYDKQQPFADRLYRINSNTTNRVGTFLTATSSPLIASRIREEFPQAEKVVRIDAPMENADHVLIQTGEQVYYSDRVWFADPELLEMFAIPFLNGSRAQSLRDPYTMLISESWAKKLFGRTDVVGETVTIEIDYDWYAPLEQAEFRITGVVEDSPVNTHLKGDFWLSSSTLAQVLPDLETEWLEYHTRFTYVRLAPGMNPVEFEQALQRVAAEHNPVSRENLGDRQIFTEFELQPVTDIHLGKDVRRNPEPMGDITYITVYASVALLILLVASINFVHLAASLSLQRAHEFSVRRAFGAFRKHMVWQFLAESLLITTIALLGAVLLVEAVLPLFNLYTGRDLSITGLGHPVVLAVMGGLVLLVMVGAGVIPATVHMLSRPVDLLRSRPGGRHRMRGQHALVFIQLVVLTILLVSTGIVQRQLAFMKGKSLGFDKEQKLVLEVKSDLPGFRTRFEDVRRALIAHPGVLNGTVSSAVPGDQQGGYYLWEPDKLEEQGVWTNVVTCDPHYTDVYGLKLVAGRLFNPDSPEDAGQGYLMTRTAVANLGFANPEEVIGKQYFAHYYRKSKEVIGVVEDFHILGMQQELKPLLLDQERSLHRLITLTLAENQIPEAMDFVRDTWAEQFPGLPFEYRFLDDIFDAQYRYEEQTSRMLAGVSAVTVIIALMGLLGLAASIVQQRRAEISIRKVLGASTMNVLSLLTRRFLPHGILAGLVGIPVSIWLLNKWFENFAYRSGIPFWIPLASWLAVMLITLGMMASQGLKSAHMKPADGIRQE